MDLNKWIKVTELKSLVSRKTKIFEVLTKEGIKLGLIQWDTGWRKYAFYPYSHTKFEEDCMRDIANFFENETKKHREMVKST